MTNKLSELIDLNLVDQVVANVPEHTWEFVTTSIIDQLVDNMTSTVLEKLTEDPCGFDKATQILQNYYENSSHEDLIVDAFKILGTENTLYMMDSWQLNKIPQNNN
jgi:spore maturation protein CgeB